ncbi:MAG: PrsW family intramembrane metalloprotease [Anaerolineales bacterium]|nr:PrsW family intramembrane metalloprotease [Anaerolineales bacterium]
MPAVVRMKLITFTLMTLVLLLFLPFDGTVSAEGQNPEDDLELAIRFAPVLYFHPAELFRPQSVDVIVETARLRQYRPIWPDINILPQVSIPDLVNYKDANFSLDVWLGDEGSSDYKNYSAHRAYYRSILSPEAGGPQILAYAHVERDENPYVITIQYWLFYYYNDWFNKHEGDWEMVQVILTKGGDPQWVVLSQHHGGTRRPWNRTKIEMETHPAVYVALGSHANYFWGNENYPNGTTIGNVQVEIMDRTGTYGRVIPKVVLIPDREDVEWEPATWTGLEWLSFGGRWGEAAPQSDFSGPLGPADKGDQWDRPHEWGMKQPLDFGAWYRNRLCVEIIGEGTKGSQVTLELPDENLASAVESLPSISLMHTDPVWDEPIFAEIVVPENTPYDLVATWPDPETFTVTSYRFEGVPPGSSGHATLTLRAGTTPNISVDGLPRVIKPSSIEAEEATWDTPDLIWVAGILPVSDVMRGLGISLIAGVLPTMLYVTLLYHADRYEKEPARLLAAAFLWGSIPAVIVAIAVQIFFRLPVDLLGPTAIEAVRIGLVAPLIEEAIKGLVVIFIAVRYRLEFDDPLDGMIYGAMVGFGFAMTGNTISYVGAFLLRGFAGLSPIIFIEGVLYGLNHGFYTSIFGAGLGYARLARSKWKRFIFPLGAFGLAVACHALHDLAMRVTVGPNLITWIVTWLGLLAMIGIVITTMTRQRDFFRTELVGEVPDELYRTLITRGGRREAKLKALWRGGPRGFLRERRIHQFCAELAIKKKQHRRLPDEKGLEEEADRIRNELQSMLDKE